MFDVSDICVIMWLYMLYWVLVSRVVLQWDERYARFRYDNLDMVYASSLNLFRRGVDETVL